MKRCPRCKVEKAHAEFATRSTGFLRSYCTPCEREYGAERQRRFYRAHPELAAARHRKGMLRRKYGITPEQYAEMLAAQDGRCGICLTDDPGGGRKFLPVDHDHATGVVRGLLCNRCNRAVGLLGDDPDLLRRAIDYLTSKAER